MNGIILYQSKYGATKKYAQWISEKTGFPCVETKQARISDVREYDTILLGGGIYASGIAGLSFLKKNIKDLQGKKIVVFCVGASPYEEKAYREIVAHNMKDGLSDIPCFYCRGAWDTEVLSIVDRNLCKLLLSTALSVTEISSLAGYSDYRVFTKVFKKTEGITPSQFRREFLDREKL